MMKTMIDLFRDIPEERIEIVLENISTAGNLEDEADNERHSIYHVFL